jgi:spore maturation protein CgeB
MKILFVGSTHQDSTSVYYFQSLVRLGHETLSWDPGFFQGRSLLERLYQQPSSKRIQQINQSLLKQLKGTQFDLVFVMGENYFRGEILNEIKSSGSKRPLFLFHSHDNLFAPGIRKPPDFFESLSAFDIAFTTKSANVAKYASLGQPNTYFVPSAFEPTIHRPIGKQSSRLNTPAQVSFVGTFDGSRIPYLEAIGWDKLHVWGNGWKKYASYRRFQESITPHAIYAFDFADAISQSACSLGLLREEADDLHTQRTFEIPACGSLQIAPRNDEIRSFFEEGKEIVLFGSADELREKTHYYLNHPADRLRIAKAGLERCLSGKHTYLDRTQTMLSFLALS